MRARQDEADDMTGIDARAAMAGGARRAAGLAAAVTLAASPLLAGCEAGFFRELRVEPPADGALGLSALADAQVIAALRAYASTVDFSCPPATALPIECRRTPMRVFAARDPAGGVIVCYAALGVPPEARRFERRTGELEDFLAARFGREHVRGAPMSSGWPAGCLQAQRGP
jgi:hypothetical protein